MENKTARSLKRNIEKKLGLFNLAGLAFVTALIMAASNHCSGKFLEILSSKGIDVDPGLLGDSYAAAAGVCIIIYMMVLLLYRKFMKAIDKMIIKPFEELEKKLEIISNGDIESVDGIEIEEDNPVMEVHKLGESTNRILERMKSYIKTQREDKEKLEEQYAELRDTGKILETINGDLENRNLKLKNILDNSNQGFFIFDRKLYSAGAYSQKCREIFECFIGGKKFSQLLHEDDQKQQEFMDDIFLKVLNPKCAQRDLYLSFLPQEEIIRGRFVKIEYKIFTGVDGQNNILVILTDVTEKKSLEGERIREKNILKMAINAILHKDELMGVIEEFNLFCENDFGVIDQDQKENLLREVHTYKGNFSQFDMINIVSHLHDMEDEIINEDENFRISSIDGYALKRVLEEDIKIIREYSGIDILKREDRIWVKESDISRLTENLHSLVPSFRREEAEKCISELRYKSVKELLKSYPDYSVSLAARLGKEIEEFEIEGDDVRVDPKLHEGFFKSLVHVFRNAIDHGIESMEERIASGKPASGRIRCMVRGGDESFTIRIENDGKVMDVDKLSETAIKKGMYTREVIDNMGKDEIFMMVFEDGFSTRDTVSSVSGRGIGLSAVRHQLQSLGGHMDIRSDEAGTVFEFTLLKGKCETAHLDSGLFMDKVVSRTKSFLEGEIGLEIEKGDIESTNRIRLNELSVLLSVRGALNAVFFLGADRSLAEVIMKKYMMDDIAEEEVDRYVRGVMTEVANTLVGNAFGDLGQVQDKVMMGISAIIENEKSYLEYQYYDVRNIVLRDIETGGCVQVSMLLLENEN